MVKKVILVFLLLFSISFISAADTNNLVELPPHELNTDLQIFQECNNCTGCNFTRVKYNGETIFANVAAIQDDTYYSFNISGGNITERGVVNYCYSCGNAVEKETGCINVPITYNGKNLTTQTAILYVAFLVFLVFLLVMLLMAIQSLPTDVRDDQGFVLEVSKLAYLRPVVKGLVWILLTAIVFIASNVAIAFLDTGLVGDFLFVIWRLMMMSNLIILPLMVIRMIQRITLSKEMLGLIERGVEFK